MTAKPAIGLIRFEKVCTRCGIEKPLAQFRKHAFTVDGHNSVCRWCERIAGWRSKGIVGEFPTEKPTICDICGRFTRDINMDHCHDTNRLRGWLCTGCNTGLGNLGDRLATLRRALAYLERFEGVNASPSP